MKKSIDYDKFIIELQPSRNARNNTEMMQVLPIQYQYLPTVSQGSVLVDSSPQIMEFKKSLK